MVRRILSCTAPTTLGVARQELNTRRRLESNEVVVRLMVRGSPSGTGCRHKGSEARRVFPKAFDSQTKETLTTKKERFGSLAVDL